MITVACIIALMAWLYTTTKVTNWLMDNAEDFGFALFVGWIFGSIVLALLAFGAPIP